jgi:hypothetical protein
LGDLVEAAAATAVDCVGLVVYAKTSLTEFGNRGRIHIQVNLILSTHSPAELVVSSAYSGMDGPAC